MKLFKLTEKDMTTRGSTLWGEGVTHSTKKKKNPVLCTGDVLHAYVNLNLAFLLNPIHANILKPLVYEAEGDVVVQDFGKAGCFSLTTVKQIPAPEWAGTKSLSQRVRIAFAVLCAEQVLSLFESRQPADERPRKAIETAKYYLLHPNSSFARAAYHADAAADAVYTPNTDTDTDASAPAAFAASAAARAASDAARAADVDAARATGTTDVDAASAAARAASDAACAAGATDVDAARAAYAAAFAAIHAADAAGAANLPKINFAELADLAVQQLTEEIR